MIQTGLNIISRFGRGFTKASAEIVDMVGAREPVDRLQETVAELPLVDQLSKVAKVASDELFGEKLALYKEEAGSHRVGTFKETFHDGTRGRQIPMTVYYPKGNKSKSPVVVFSHGFAGNATTYRYLGKHLASHGYTVMQPTHVGSNTKAAVLKTPLFSFTQEELVERKKDISFALDLVENKELPKAITQQADMEHIAVAGHSFGALTAQAMAGVEAIDDSGEAIELQDDRVDAFVAVSPYGDSMPTHLLGLDVESYDQIEKPVMFIHGEKDTLFTLGKGSDTHSLPFHGASSEDKYQVIVHGARHVSFAQVVGVADPETVDMTNSSTVAFLDAHLLGDEAAGKYLQEDFPAVARSRKSQAFSG